MFVNRITELARLNDWWRSADVNLALVWGRRRVGKTALLTHFAADKPSVFHTGTQRSADQELKTLSRHSIEVLGDGLRDLEARPFADWLDALEALANAAREKPLLLVLDEFPELVASVPELPSILRAFWDHARGKTQLKIVLSGSAVRTMEAMQEERAPLFGRVDLRLLLHPFRPHEASELLPRLAPADRAKVWCLLGGVPLYLQWWDSERTFADNIERLVCTPGGRLLTEGAYVLATEGDGGTLAKQILYAVAGGATRFNEIQSVVGTNPARTLDDLVALRLVERIAPVTEDPRRTRRSTYRVADNFLHFWLGVVDRYRSEIERGLGRSILPVLLKSLDNHIGPRWEDAFRDHLRRLAAEGALVPDIVAVGPYWTQGKAAFEIDAMALAGQSRRIVLLGEAKWGREVDARRIRARLASRLEALPDAVEDPIYAICAREAVNHAEGCLALTAADLFP